MTLVAAVAMFASCDRKEPDTPETVTPTFPNVVENYNVTPGETLTLTFEANMDWSVSVPASDLQWFWIQDASFKVDKVSGKVASGSKESVTVVIGVSEKEEFDQNRSCDVTLTMGGESKVIAKYMRPAKNRTLAVYAAKVENSEFVMNESGEYEYDSAEASSLDFIWSAAEADFMMPVKVEANCEWTMEVPEWLSVQVPETTTGVLNLVLTGASLEAATGKITFKAGDAVLKEISVSVPSCSEVNVYSTQLDDLGEFRFDEEGDYLYSAEPVEAVTLVWPGSDFRMPVMVDAKCDWTLELPAWAKAVYSSDEPQEKAGVMQFTLMGNPLLYPLEETTSKMVFKYQGETVKEIALTIPGAADKFSYNLEMSLSEWEFNAAGELMTTAGYQSVAATATIYGTSAATVKVVEIVDGKKTVEDPSWVSMELQTFDKSADVLQHRTVTVSPTVNEGSNREAYVLFCKDGYDADVYFAADGTLNEAMSKYAVRLIQHGTDMDYVTMISSPEAMAEVGATFAVSENPRLTTYFGDTKYKYTLTYTDVYARDEAYMSLAKPFASYKIFNGTRKDVTADETFWLKFTVSDDTNTSGVVDMYMDMELPAKAQTAYLVFYDADGSTLAIIECVFDPTAVAVDEFVIEFAEQSATIAAQLGFTLEKLTEGEIFDLYYDGQSPVYHLTYTDTEHPLSIKIPSKVKSHNVNPWEYKNCFRVNDVIYDEFFGPNGVMGEIVLAEDSSVTVHMSMPEDASTTMIRGNVNFLSGSGGTVFVLVCTLDLAK